MRERARDQTKTCHLNTTTTQVFFSASSLSVSLPLLFLSSSLHLSSLHLLDTDTAIEILWPSARLPPRPAPLKSDAPKPLRRPWASLSQVLNCPASSPLFASSERQGFSETKKKAISLCCYKSSPGLCLLSISLSLSSLFFSLPPSLLSACLLPDLLVAFVSAPPRAQMDL